MNFFKKMFNMKTEDIGPAGAGVFSTNKEHSDIDECGTSGSSGVSGLSGVSSIDEEVKKDEYVYKLRVYNKNDKLILSLYNEVNCRYLLKVYNWYLLRDSKKYDVVFREGRCCLNRDCISSIYFDKVKKNK